MKIHSFQGEAGDRFFVFACPQHGTHVVVGMGRNGFASCLHLGIEEALELADVLRAGSTWVGLVTRPPLPNKPETDGDRQGGKAVRDGLWSVTMRGDTYVLSLAPNALPGVMAQLGPNSREKVAGAISEVVHGKAVAA